MATLVKGFGGGFAETCRREIGFTHPRCFSRGISASEVLVNRINLYGKLNGHEGCVNTVEFNSTGEVLVSGSDDRKVIFWDWATETKRFSYTSGHSDNIFQTRIMPFTDDRKIVTSSGDGQVRLGQVSESGQVCTKRLGKHLGNVYKLAVEPGSPYIIYSCGNDGFVQHFDLRNNSATKLFVCSSFTKDKQHPSSSVRLKSIVIDPRNPNYFAVGGSDEYARVYDIRQYHSDASSHSDMPVNTFCPHHLIGTEDVHITGLAYSNTSELLVSYNDELVYLFQKNMGMGSSPLAASSENLQKLDDAQAYLGHRNSRTVKGVSFFGPNDEYVLSGSDCGHIFMWKKKGAKLVHVMVGDQYIANHIEPHPFMPVLASCGIEQTVKLWAPMPEDTLPLPDDVEEIMEANRQGREDSRLTLTPDVIMHVLRLQGRQTMAYIERRQGGADADGEGEDEGGAYVFRFTPGDATSEESFTGDSRECNIT